MLSISADRIVVPLASESDARATCESLLPYLTDGARVTVVHVIEKAGGAPDKASVEQREERAQDIFAVARDVFEAEGRAIDAEIVYGTDVADTIFDAASDLDAEMVVVSPREASRLARFLSGDVAINLVTDPDLPVLVLPGADNTE